MHTRHLEMDGSVDVTCSVLFCLFTGRYQFACALCLQSFSNFFRPVTLHAIMNVTMGKDQMLAAYLSGGVDKADPLNDAPHALYNIIAVCIQPFKLDFPMRSLG